MWRQHFSREGVERERKMLPVLKTEKDFAAVFRRGGNIVLSFLLSIHPSSSSHPSFLLFFLLLHSSILSKLGAHFSFKHFPFPCHWIIIFLFSFTPFIPTLRLLLLLLLSTLKLPLISLPTLTTIFFAPLSHLYHLSFLLPWSHRYE